MNPFAMIISTVKKDDNDDADADAAADDDDDDVDAAADEADDNANDDDLSVTLMVAELRPLLSKSPLPDSLTSHYCT